MQKINVIDLDGTLLPYDSFGLLVKSELKKFDLLVWCVSALRTTRLISAYKFKKILMTYWIKKYDTSFFINYANHIYQDLDKKVLGIVQSKTDLNTTNILISASPDVYIIHIIQLLQWQGSGSFIESGKFVNLYSAEKISWLKSHYPIEKYQYNFSISDSRTDENLLALFEESILWDTKVKSRNYYLM